MTTKVAGGVQVTINGETVGVFDASSRIIARGLNGNDNITVASNVFMRTELDGGAGNDVLTGASQADVLIGGEGNDTLIGRAGRDILLGGSGIDTLSGGSQDDVLVGGDVSTGVGQNLHGILREWTRQDLTFSQRVAHLNGQTSGGFNSAVINAESVTDDGLADISIAAASTDWTAFAA